MTQPMQMSMTPAEASRPGLRALVAQKDWSATPLGPPETWSEALRTTVATCLGSRFPVIIFWGPELVQVYNDAYVPLIGAKHPGALGQTAAACFPEVWDVIGPMLHGVLETGEATWSDDLLLMLERGGFPEECYFTFSYSPAGGAPVEGVFCAVIETTRRVIGERRLDVLRDLSVSLAGARRVDQALRDAIAVLGRHPSDLPAGLLRHGGGPDRCWAAVGHGPVNELLTEAAHRVEREGRAVVDTRAAPDGQSRTVAAYTIGRPGSAGAVATVAFELNPHLRFDDAYRDFLSLVVSTISAGIAGAEAYEEAEQRARALEELDRAKTTFLSNVSHEFRTPLTLLLGPLHDHSTDPALPDAVRRDLAMAERNGRRLLKLVNSLLDIARLEAGRMTASFEATNLAALTRDLVAMFQSAADAAGLDLVVDCPDLAEPAHVDREMWEQIVTNLCANALKYTPSGSVTVRLRRSGDSARLDVIDTGIGISADEADRIFDRFRRAQAPGARSQEGTGIGLALVRELVDLHGGTIGVDSAPGAGSTFTVVVPLRGEPDPAADRARSLSTSPVDVVDALDAVLRGGSIDADRPDRSTPAPTLAGEQASVFVIDDNADMRAYLAGLLGRERVTTFDDARVALDAARRMPPDVILTDVMMPGLGGFAFLEQLRGHPATARIPVILVSARAGEEATIEGLEAGADDYIVKPFTGRALLARVRSHLELAALRRDTIETAVRHTGQLAALATAAGDMLAAETLDDIIGVVERSAREVTGAATCAVSLQRPASAPRSAHASDPTGITVPLSRADGPTFGALRVVPHPGHPLEDTDRALLVELSRIAARRIERFYSYQREHHLADTLQRSLLPQTTPRVAGFELVTRYRPATDAAAVGGDWYDAVALPDGRLLLAIGDVMGHDLAAAVAMGQLRHLFRAHASDSPGPAELCSTVNRLLPTIGGDQIATAAVVFVDPTTGQGRIVSAGHPPAVLVDPDGSAALVDVPAALPLGIQPDASHPSAAITLQPGSTLLLYTDGLIERRDKDFDDCLTELVDASKVLRGPSLDEGIDALLRAQLGERSVGDDVAILAVRRHAGS